MQYNTDFSIQFTLLHKIEAKTFILAVMDCIWTWNMKKEILLKITKR